jgi:Putative Ig domain
VLRMTRLACALSSLAVLASCGGGSASTPPPQPLSIATSSLADAFVNFAYTQTIQASGGVPPFTWTVSSGNLPHGVALGGSSTNSVTVSGTPDSAQAALSFTIRVADAANQTAGKSYTITINTTGSADLQEVQGHAPSGTIEIQGVSAGAFNPDYWQKDTLNWVPDVRIPMLAAQPTGPNRNI